MATFETDEREERQDPWAQKGFPHLEAQRSEPADQTHLHTGRATTVLQTLKRALLWRSKPQTSEHYPKTKDLSFPHPDQESQEERKQSSWRGSDNHHQRATVGLHLVPKTNKQTNPGGNDLGSLVSGPAMAATGTVMITVASKLSWALCNNSFTSLG